MYNLKIIVERKNDFHTFKQGPNEEIMPLMLIETKKIGKKMNKGSGPG